MRRAIARLVMAVLLFACAGTAYADIFFDAGMGREAAVRKYLDEGGDVNAAAGGATLLHYAVMNNQVAVVKLLLERKADVNSKKPSGATPLHVAAEKDLTEIVSLLVAAGGDMDAEDGRGRTPRQLLEKHAKTAPKPGADPKMSAILAAAEQGDVAAVKQLLGSGVSPNARDSFGRTPLTVAASRGHLEVVALLLDRGAKTNTDSPRQTASPALVFASEKGSVELVRTLLDHGAKVNGSFGDSGTPLIMAIRGGNSAVVKLLLSRGAGVSARGFCGETPLHAAASKGDLDLVKLLVARGAGVNVRYTSGNRRTPLAVAKAAGQTAVVAFLRARGAR